MKKRHLLFIRDVIIYTFTAFGGPQAHIAVLLREFVERRRYITEQELIELNALSQLLPGPSSTQTLVGIAWKVGGLRLAIITFLIWILPSAAIMCIAAISYKMFAGQAKFSSVLRFVQPVAVGIVAYATYTFAHKFYNKPDKYHAGHRFAGGVAYFTECLRFPDIDPAGRYHIFCIRNASAGNGAAR